MWGGGRPRDRSKGQRPPGRAATYNISRPTDRSPTSLTLRPATSLEPHATIIIIVIIFYTLGSIDPRG